MFKRKNTIFFQIFYKKISDFCLIKNLENICGDVTPKAILAIF